MQKLKKVVNIIIDVLIVIMLIISAIVAAMSLASQNDGISNLFGYAPLSVQSDSMVPTFEQGDLLISKVVYFDTPIEKGDVITFTENIGGVESLNTHRVIDIDDNDGFKMYTTRGDNAPEDSVEIVSQLDVLAVYTGTNLKGFGNVYDFLTSQLGFFLVILLPLILFFIYEVFRVVRNLIEYNKEKAISEALETSGAKDSGLSEEELKIAVEKYLAQQNREKEISGNPEQADMPPSADLELVDPGTNSDDTEE